MSKTIPMLDLMFYLTETPDNPRHVGAVQIFRRPARARKSLVKEIVEAYRAAVPVAPFNRVPEFPKVGFPRWREVDRFDMSHHVLHLALPPPGSNQQLHELIAELHAPIMDRHRPGWKTYVIEGLEGGRFALYHKVHHALVDGESGMQIMRRSLSASAQDQTIRTTVSTRLTTSERSREVPQGLRRILEKEARNLAKRTLSVGRGSARLVESALEGLRGFSEQQTRAFTAPHTPLNEPIYNARSITHCVFPLAGMKSIARCFGATLNDVALAVVDAGVERYLSELGRPPEHPLVCVVPVSLRDAEASEATTQTSAIWPLLGEVSAPVAQRLKTIMANTAAGKEELRSMGKDAAYAFAVMSFAMSETLVIAKPEVFGMLPANLLVSNVRGPDQPLYLNGAQLEALFPVSTLIVGLGLNVTFMSYDDKVVMGFTGNGSALPNIESMGHYTEQAFETLQKAAAKAARRGSEPAARRPAKRKAARPRKKR